VTKYLETMPGRASLSHFLVRTALDVAAVYMLRIDPRKDLMNFRPITDREQSNAFFSASLCSSKSSRIKRP
jgi:hypothetical protein